MAYEHDVFISYKRCGRFAANWVNTFRDALEFCLEPLLGRRVFIFKDDMIEAGSSFPLELSRGLASSRMVLALFSATYFNSRWCTSELALIRAREARCRYRTRRDPRFLIVGAQINGDLLPREHRDMQYADFRAYYSLALREDTPKWVRFSEAMNNLARAVAKAIENAPVHDPAWERIAYRRFYQTFYQETRSSAPLDRPPALVPARSIDDIDASDARARGKHRARKAATAGRAAQATTKRKRQAKGRGRT